MSKIFISAYKLVLRLDIFARLYHYVINNRYNLYNNHIVVVFLNVETKAKFTD